MDKDDLACLWTKEQRKNLKRLTAFGFVVSRITHGAIAHISYGDKEINIDLKASKIHEEVLNQVYFRGDMNGRTEVQHGIKVLLNI